MSEKIEDTIKNLVDAKATGQQAEQAVMGVPIEPAPVQGPMQ